MNTNTPTITSTKIMTRATIDTATAAATVDAVDAVGTVDAAGAVGTVDIVDAAGHSLGAVTNCAGLRQSSEI